MSGHEPEGRDAEKRVAVKAPPLLRAVKPPLPPARTNAAPAVRAVEDTGARPRAVLRVGRYEVNARIAVGGMATVHLGRVLGAAGFSRVVAIKRLLPQFAADPEFESMFVAEAQLAARIHHPNVVPTLDVVSIDGELLLVMEYVSGESLARLTNAAREAGDVPQGVALAVICDALHGLHAAHEAKDRHGQPLGIVHRDMSPQNVIVGVDGVARVIDFGIAKAANSVNITREGMVRGKAAYMAPEQLSCEPLTRRTDLYPLGVMLWELLVGERLFPGGTRPDLIAKVEGRIPRPRSRVPGIPLALDEIVMRALATEESARFTDAREMAQAIEAAAPLAARSQIAPWVERHAAAALAERAELLAHVDATARSVPPPANVTVAPAQRLDASAALQPAGVPSISVPNLVFTGAARETSAGPLLSGVSRRKGRLALTAGLGLGVLLAAIGLAFALGAAHEPALATKVAPADAELAMAAPTVKAVAPTPAQPALAAEPTPTPSIAPPSPPKADPVANQLAHPASAPQPREAHKASPAKVSTKASKAKNCTPPYTTDAQGRRKYKAECF